MHPARLPGGTGAGEHRGRGFGGAQSYLNLAIAQDLDAFITGEVSEYNYHLAREEGVHHVSVGHHASERVGPRCLARYLSENFPVEAEFVDVPNPA